jgi:hypothetical protein
MLGELVGELRRSSALYIHHGVEFPNNESRNARSHRHPERLAIRRHVAHTASETGTLTTWTPSA